jgi:hypothetical protein
MVWKVNAKAAAKCLDFKCITNLLVGLAYQLILPSLLVEEWVQIQLFCVPKNIKWEIYKDAVTEYIHLKAFFSILTK